MPETERNRGRARSTKMRAKIQDTLLFNIDSLKNCRMILPLSAPMTFRKPTSLALFAERAVERFMKLIQAMIRTKIAIAVKI